MKIDIDLSSAYKLFGSGPVVLVSAQHEGKKAVMTNAWNCPQDFNPTKMLLVIGADSVTRKYAEASGELVISLPTGAQKELICKIGSAHSDVVDKFKDFNIDYEAGEVVKAPKINGCLA